jgi:hypothetical protein
MPGDGSPPPGRKRAQDAPHAGAAVEGFVLQASHAVVLVAWFAAVERSPSGLA